MRIDFAHRQSAHCETGVTAGLLGFHGLALSEPLALGIGAGVFFAYLPFLTLNGAPGLSFRVLPGWIFSGAAGRLGARVARRKFRRPEAAMRALDEVLDRGIPVGCVVGVYHLPYFPPAYRFHFNAHNLVVYGREGERYLVSDPIMEEPSELTREELARVRFAHGVFAPHGHMYWVEGRKGDADLPRAVRSGVAKTTARMLGIPVPLFGVRGIRFLARRLRAWPAKAGPKKAALWLGMVVRMQEEIGTGGGGFRFMYAAFLQEAAGVLGDPRLGDLSRDMTAAGDRWREFAVQAARIYKERSREAVTYDHLAGMLEEIAGREERIFRALRATIP